MITDFDNEVQRQKSQKLTVWRLNRKRMTKLKKEVNVPEVEKSAFWVSEETKGRNSKITEML